MNFKIILISSDTQVFGLEPNEIQALSKKFNSPCKQIENGVMFKKSVATVINSLGQLGKPKYLINLIFSLKIFLLLGYKIVSSCGETETIFTMQREV